MTYGQHQSSLKLTIRKLLFIKFIFHREEIGFTSNIFQSRVPLVSEICDITMGTEKFDDANYEAGDG